MRLRQAVRLRCSLDRFTERGDTRGRVSDRREDYRGLRAGGDVARPWETRVQLVQLTNLGKKTMADLLAKHSQQ